MCKIVERFAHMQSMWVPTLTAWQSPKNMCVTWNDCGMRDYYEFRSAVDTGGMNAELFAMWQRWKPQCDRRASFSWGDVFGHMSWVSHDCAWEAMDIVRRYYTEGMMRMKGEEHELVG